jgi:hypothetical protein
MSRWCDRSIYDAGHSDGSNGLLLGRFAVWNSRRRNHLGQRSCASAPTGRTYGRKRSDQSTAKTLAGRGPSTYGAMSAAGSTTWPKPMRRSRPRRCSGLPRCTKSRRGPAVKALPPDGAFARPRANRWWRHCGSGSRVRLRNYQPVRPPPRRSAMRSIIGRGSNASLKTGASSSTTTASNAR